MTNDMILRTIEENGGVTLYDGEIINYSIGYQVALKGFEVVTSAELLDEVINEYKTNFSGVGVWFNTDNNKYYVDVVEYFENKEEAIKVGLDNEQLAIWDWSSFTEISLAV